MSMFNSFRLKTFYNSYVCIIKCLQKHKKGANQRKDTSTGDAFPNYEFMEGPLGLEPRTRGLKGHCSNRLSYGPMLWMNNRDFTTFPLLLSIRGLFAVVRRARDENIAKRAQDARHNDQVATLLNRSIQLRR